mgnify:CR=1 FL=1
MLEMTVNLPSDVVRHLAQEAERLGLSYSKHLLATLDVMATTKSKELINDELTDERTTAD